MRMLRTPFLCLVAITAPIAQGLAQRSSSDLSFGLTGAFNQSTFGGSDASNQGQKSGFELGAFLRKPINETWVFQGELQYTMKGTKVTAPGASASVEFGYIELPLMFRAFLGGNESMRPYIEAGPGLAFNLSCNVSATLGSDSQSSECASIGANPKTFDAGLIGGAGIEFGKLAFGVRYDYGLINVGNGGNFKNRNLQAAIGFRF